MPIPFPLAHKLQEIERVLGYSFRQPELLASAFTHRSYANESQTPHEHNERLEFLGDAILGSLIAEYLFEQFPALPEGELSSLRSRLVESAACTHYIEILGVASYLLLGKGEQQNWGRGRSSILADLFEAIIGALYLDGGIIVTKNFLFSHFGPAINELIAHPTRNCKADLQDWCQRTHQVTPTYEVLGESGPDHKRSFHIAVFCGEKRLGEGMGGSKKEAQQSAARAALLRIEEDG